MKRVFSVRLIHSHVQQGVGDHVTRTGNSIVVCVQDGFSPLPNATTQKLDRLQMLQLLSGFVAVPDPILGEEIFNFQGHYLKN